MFCNYIQLFKKYFLAEYDKCLIDCVETALPQCAYCSNQSTTQSLLTLCYTKCVGAKVSNLTICDEECSESSEEIDE